MDVVLTDCVHVMSNAPLTKATKLVIISSLQRKNEMINICVACDNENVVVQNDVEFRSDENFDLLNVFITNFDVSKNVSVEEGLKEVEQYGIDYYCQLDNWTESVEKYKELIDDKVGKFYLWSVETDLSLIFVEDSEQLPELSEEFE